MPTATTYLKSHKRADKRTALQSLKDRFDYGLNPEKLGAVSSYLCDPATAHAEFMLVKNQYQGETDRRAGHGALCYQIRQAFPHGEVTAEEANRIGYETAMRWTKGKYQFFVCTHIDKEHIHNHIYYNSTAYDRSRKFRNFIGSSFALRRLSDRVCLEHDLSVIANPKLHSKGRYLHYGQWLGENQKLSQKEQICLAIDAALTERPVDFADFLRRMETAGIQVKHGRGGVISFLVPGQQRAARFRASTLGDGYGPEDVQAVIDGKAPTRTATARKAPAPRRVNLLIDIQERMRQGKGPAYERWAKVYNLKQMAAALQYLKEHRLFEYDDLAAKTDAATEQFHTLAGDIQQTEAELSRVSDLMVAVVQYAKTRPAFDGYKAAKYAAEAIGGLEYSPCRGCVANTAHNNHTGSRPTGPFCLMTAQTIPARRLPLLWIETENNCPAASGHRGQRWGKVKGRRFRAVLSRFPTDNGKPSNLFTPLIVIGGFQMTEARVGYHKEVKTASFQGKSITVENLTPMLSPRARDKRKREIESCLYEVFVKYAPGRAQMH